jgi:hypothetical protein
MHDYLLVGVSTPLASVRQYYLTLPDSLAVWVLRPCPCSQGKWHFCPTVPLGTVVFALPALSAGV